MNAIDLCLLEDVKAWLNLAPESDGDDALLARLITAESQRVAQYLNVDAIKARDVSITFSGNGRQTLVFGQQINSVASLSLNGVEVGASTGNGGGFVFGGTQLSLRGGLFPKGLQNCQISFNVGYQDVPFDIEQAAIELVCYRYRERDRIGHASKTLGSETVTFITSEMPSSVKAKLQNYMRVTPTAWGL